MQTKKQKVEIQDYFASRNRVMQSGYGEIPIKISKEEHLRRIRLEQQRKLHDTLKDYDSI